jgi:ribosome-associated heat shock protein Hsp15
MQGAAPSERLDKWLWHARLCKSRSLAAQLVAKGAIRVNSVRVTKPATPVRVGDGLSFALHGRVRVLRVAGIAARRGPATEARTLYVDLGEDCSARPGPGLDPEGGIDT